MPATTLDNLRPATDLSKRNYMLVSQSGIGRRASLDDILEFISGTSIEEGLIIPNAGYLPINQSVNLSEEQKQNARANLGIDSSGEVVSGSVISVNGLDGEVNLYISNIKASATDSRTSTDITQALINEHNVDSVAHSGVINSAIESALATANGYVVAHNNDSTAHRQTISSAITTALTNYVTYDSLPQYISTYQNKSGFPQIGVAGRIYIDNSPSAGYPDIPYIWDTSLTDYINISPLKLSDLTDDISDVKYTIQTLGDAEKTTARTNIGAIGSVNGKSGDSISLAPSDIGAIASGFKINNVTLEGVSATMSAADVGAVPTTRTINGQPLSANVTLNASNVGALDLTGGSLTGNLTMASSSKIILNSSMYGSSLPSSGVAGQIFFVYV